jgi:maleylpyruvate isomerase
MSLADARGWMRDGTELLLAAADRGEIEAASALPGWTRQHLVAHVAANADALGNLVHWAATGESTPMYASPEERAAGIERGSRLPRHELLAWLRDSAESLEAAMADLTDEQWQTPVTTAQGRTIPATEVPWLRAREVWVHAVDLATGTSFTDLPADFLAALVGDVIGKRSRGAGPALVLETADQRWDLPGDGTPVLLVGPLADIVAYLTGRTHSLTAADGAPVPRLSAWL